MRFNSGRNLSLLVRSESYESAVDSIDSWTLCISHSSGNESNDDDNGTVYQSVSVLQLPVPKEWSSTVKDISPHPFIGTQGLNVSPLQYNIFFNDNLIELIVKVTKTFAEREEKRKLHAHYRLLRHLLILHLLLKMISSFYQGFDYNI